MKLFVLLTVSFVATAPIGAQTAAHPLGVTFGMPLPALRRLIPLDTNGRGGNPYTYFSKTAPSPNGAFDLYAYIVTPKRGLCTVIASTPPERSDNDGESARAGFERLRAALEAKYGPGDVKDELQDGSIWSEPQDWTNALYHKERTLLVAWRSPETHSRFPDLDGLVLATSSADPGYIHYDLMYVGPDHEGCDAEVSAAKNATL